MNVMIRNRIRLYTFAGSLVLQTLAVYAQTQPPSAPPAYKNATDTAAQNRMHSFYAGTGGGNNLLYLGSTMSQGHGFGFASVSYGLMDKIYFSATGYTVNKLSPFTAFYSLGLSFNHTFNSWFDISAGFSRYNVSAPLRDTLFDNFSYADVTLGFDWKILYSKISAGSLFSGDKQFYLQTRHSSYFETPSFAGGKAFFSFDPYINILSGTVVSIETSGDVKETTVSPGFRPWRKKRQGSNPSPVTTYNEYFGLMEIDFGFPAAFSYDFFTIELEPGYVIPLYSLEGSSGTGGFLFMASLFLKIF